MSEPIHRWYHSVMGFPPTLVRQAISDLDCRSSGWLLDPFCGTGTTLIESKRASVSAIGVDANPFSAFCSQAKTDWTVDPKELSSTLARMNKVIMASEKPPRVRVADYPHTVKNGWVTPVIWARASTYFDLSKRIRKTNLRDIIQLAIISAIKEDCADVAFGPEIYKRARKRHVSVYSGPLCQDTIWVKVKIASVLSFEMNWLLVSSRCK